jgi:uncharacterized membrane protein YedE/YeeE
MTNFTPWSSLAGGLLIGVAAAALLLLNGQVAGISGICGALLDSQRAGRRWRALFVGGLLVGGALAAWARPAAFVYTPARSSWALVAAGLLVGFGTRLGHGCTSGHGLCGLSRLSRRSIVATGVFMAAAAATVLVINRALGGAL